MLLRFAIINFLLIFALPLNGQDEIRVALTTKTKLARTYLSKIHTQDSTLPLHYARNLRNILEFDLGHSGFCTLVKTDPILEKALQHTDPNISFNASRWTKTGASIVIKALIKENKLDIYLFNVNTGSLKKFEGVALSGKANVDRCQMHRLSDALIQTNFGAIGVADTRLLYSVQKENADPSSAKWEAEIWECDWDGKNPKQVTHEKNYAISPTFFPPNSSHANDRFLFVNYKNGQPKIHLFSLTNPKTKPFLALRGNQLLPALSKNRDKIAFISDASGRADLFVQAIGPNGATFGKPQQLFSYPRSTQASPTFSPDAKKIAFVSDKDGTPRIYIISSSLEKDKRPKTVLITKKNRENTCPSWSPNGKKIAYSAKTNGIRQIWIYDCETKEEEQLTTGPGNKENPCWGPDSLHLVFNSTDPDASDLYLVNLNQPEAVKITCGPGKKHYPTWGTR